MLFGVDFAGVGEAFRNIDVLHAPGIGFFFRPFDSLIAELNTARVDRHGVAHGNRVLGVLTRIEQHRELVSRKFRNIKIFRVHVEVVVEVEGYGIARVENRRVVGSRFDIDRAVFQFAIVEVHFDRFA